MSMENFVLTNTALAQQRNAVQPGELARGTRNQRSAFEFQQNRPAEENCADASEFKDRTPKPRGPTARSANWKQRKNQNKGGKKKEDAAVTSDFRATDETSPVDEPFYDMGPHSSPIQVGIYSQNYDFSGYIDQIERTYVLLCGIDPGLKRKIPFSMFQHSMCTIFNCYVLDVAYENGESKLGSGKCQDYLPGDLCIPDNLYHYMINIGNTKTATGVEVHFNLPDAAIPKAAADGIPAGSFGPVNAHNHNLYECYISPLVTSNRVLNSRRPAGADEVPPLPAAAIPAGGAPTRNLLGHGPPDMLPPEARQRIEGFDFPDGNSMEARLRVSPELMARVNIVLFELRSRFKMRDIGRSSPTLRNYVTPKHFPGNVQYVCVEEVTPDVQKLSYKQNQIRSSAACGSACAGKANINCHRRERTNGARGLCYNVNGAAPAGWDAHINDNFEMIGVFAPTIGVTIPMLRTMGFVSHAPRGLRLSTIDNYLKRNFYIPAR